MKQELKRIMNRKMVQRLFWQKKTRSKIMRKEEKPQSNWKKFRSKVL
jgi:hypothetical protein